MSECTFCPNERYTSIWAQTISMEKGKEIPVCINCIDQFEAEVKEE